MPYLRTSRLIQRQHGAAFIIMLVILIMGVSIYLVSSLSKVTLQTARNEKSSDLLAQAKEIVIGYAVNGTGGTRPGDLMIPDVLSSTETPPYNYDGVTEGGCLDASKTSSTPIPGLPVIGGGASNWTNMRCLGRMPWKSFNVPLGSPSENDPTGFMPWYAVSANLVDPTHVTPLNSELLNTDNTLHGPNNYPPAPHPWLTVRDMNGNVLSNRVAFVIIIPGATLPGQSRPLSASQGGPGLGGANQYLDSITVPPTCTAPCVPGTYNNFDMDDDFIMGDEHRWIASTSNPGQQIEDPNYHFNDKLLYVTIDELMPLIEKRIAREVKGCLDNYASNASNTNNRYPWAASVTDNTPFPVNLGDPSRPGAYGTNFGRIPESPDTSTTSGSTPPTGTLLTYIQAVQTALNNYLSNTNSTTLSTLRNKGDTLKDYAQSIGQATTDPARAAGITADNCTGLSCTSTLQSQLTTAMGGGTPDPSMPANWTTPACISLFTSPGSYWADWRDLVFYQVTTNYQPGGGANALLQISGSGNPNGGNGTYRASVIVAGKKLGTQTRANPYVDPPNDYLANPISEFSADPLFVTNAHSDTTLTTSFITYKTSDPYYQNINDLVLCLDGKGINPTSQCN
ncbi:hypothetical protein GALL_68650 [mine drainage metagenome]|uniref:Uncharacterized protein n=1 Tax=mine drainage metagenome TaxID=410659 RepID=A0A1J5TC75_9ZZZZ